MTLLGTVWKAEDNRDDLEKAGKYEIWKFAQERGVTEITYDMPTQVARRILRARGITDIGIPSRPLGGDQRTVYNAEVVAPAPRQQSENSSMTAEDLLEQEYRQSMEIKTPAQMGMNELRAECKRRNIKMDRRDNLNTLRGKLSENAA